MDEYSQIEFVEARNADHRTPQRPGSVGPVVPMGTRTFVAQPRYPTQSPYGAQSPYFYPQPGVGIGIGTSGSLFGRMTTGQVIDMVAQIFAALMPLPAQPNVTSDAATDAGNVILYQAALAQHAKRDEQVRTLGNLIVKLVG